MIEWDEVWICPQGPKTEDNENMMMQQPEGTKHWWLLLKLKQGAVSTGKSPIRRGNGRLQIESEDGQYSQR